MIEMAAEDDFSGAAGGPRNGRGHDRPVPGPHFGLDVRAEHDRNPCDHLRAQAGRRGARYHEGKPLRQRAVQMPPAHDVRVEAGPGGSLIRHVTDDAGRAIFRDP